MKVKPSIRPRCKYCRIVIRRGRIGGPKRYIRCQDRNHNQRQG